MLHPKPKYKVGQSIVGRTQFEAGADYGDKIVMIEIESALYDTQYGHWQYFGRVAEDELVTITEYEVERKFK